ncbi:unnamed protein product [Choristocarpus tenellus]
MQPSVKTKRKGGEVEEERSKRHNSEDLEPRFRTTSDESTYTTDENFSDDEEGLTPPAPKSSTAPRRWDSQEDRRLTMAVQRHGEANWKAIALHVGSRNHVQCLQRWKKVLCPGLIKGQWSADEDAVLMKLAVAGYKNWGQLAIHMPGRTSKQCRERWCHHLDPSINKSDYTPHEDRIIISSQKQLGNKWSQIASKLPGRTENAIKIRWKALQRRMVDKNRDEGNMPKASTASARRRASTTRGIKATGIRNLPPSLPSVARVTGGPPPIPQLQAPMPIPQPQTPVPIPPVSSPPTLRDNNQSEQLPPPIPMPWVFPYNKAPTQKEECTSMLDYVAQQLAQQCTWTDTRLPTRVDHCPAPLTPEVFNPAAPAMQCTPIYRHAHTQAVKAENGLGSSRFPVSVSDGLLPEMDGQGLSDTWVGAPTIEDPNTVFNGLSLKDDGYVDLATEQVLCSPDVVVSEGLLGTGSQGGTQSGETPLRMCCSFLDLPGEGMVVGEMPLNHWLG